MMELHTHGNFNVARTHVATYTEKGHQVRNIEKNAGKTRRKFLLWISHNRFGIVLFVCVFFYSLVCVWLETRRLEIAEYVFN